MEIKPDSKLIVSLPLTIMLLVSCGKKEGVTFADKHLTNFSRIFDTFWNDMSTNYVYWDIDTTNWDGVYNRYKPVFDHLNLQDKTDVQKSISYFRQMTNGLIDSHYAISFIPVSIADSVIFPASDRKLGNKNFHGPFPYLSIDSAYFDKGYVSGNYKTKANELITATCATINNKILYFGCSQFNLLEAYTSSATNGVKAALSCFFYKLQNLPASIKGLIIDVRNNRGGNLVDLNFLVGQFIDKPLLFGYTHYKSGNGRLSFTPWVEANIIPQTSGKAINIPVIVLADNYSMSLAEAVTMAIKAIPGSKFIGETTWGATGPITDEVLYDDGQFEVPGFLYAYTSSAAFKYIDGMIYEGRGFNPDIIVPFDAVALHNRDDQQLDKAILSVK